MKKMLFLLFFCLQAAFSQPTGGALPLRQKESVWVDSVYNAMGFDERVGQLFMVSAFSNKDSLHVNYIKNLVSCYHVGGLLFLQGGPGRQAKLTNKYQQLSKVPLFIGIDAEWGLAMRLDSINRFPWNMTLGAIQDISLINKVGVEYGRQTARIGAHFDFAPVLDINTNPKNPIIGNRSFGEDKENVTQRALALMKGIQSQNVLATGKHFPGHGDTSVDSHLTLPVVAWSRERLESVEFYPYRRLFNEGLASVMVAHLNVPSLESREGYPSSISYNVVTNVLQKELGFNGLIFTDALNMKGASNFKQPGEIDLAAFLAGNDILLFPENVPVAYEKFCTAYQDSVISEERLAQSVKKILKYKYRVGLDRYKPIKIERLQEDLNTRANDALQYELYENAVTVIKNQDDVLPIKALDKEKIAYVRLGDDKSTPFLQTLQKYTEVTEINEDNLDSLKVRLKPFSTVIVGFHKPDGAWKNHSWKPEEVARLDTIAKYNRVILDVFAKPYCLMQVDNFANIKGIVVSYQNTDVSQVVSAELIFGAIASKGKLPVTINSMFPVNFGLQTQKLDRLGFALPENEGMDSKVLDGIEALAQKAISGKMTPGMQILVARHGKVVYQKAFGTHSYDNPQKVQNSDVYDVASITKMVSTLPNVMQAYDQGKVNLESTVGDMVPAFADSDKKNIRFKELLSHYARLQPWIPFYKKTLDSTGHPSEKYYSKSMDAQHTRQVAENLFIRNDYHDTIIKAIADSKLLPKKEYKYSDFTFIILKEYLEKSTGKTLDSLSQQNFYRSLGMTSTTYNPLHKIDMSAIPPTENDNYFRYQTIQGYVHDMEAAMEGGVGGHAGIFSNTMDIAKMMQLYLNKGSYGGQRYFSEKTFTDFNTCWFCAEGNRRGLGFDKQQLPGQAGPTCGCVSSESFGHTGFTGGIAWADPQSDLIYVFLSNRTYPDSNAPNKLSKENIREDIQKVIQQAIVR